MEKTRQIAIFTDIHGLKEPLEAIIKDINKRGITEIYSLGDNIGEGPNSGEVIDILEKSHVKSIAGNAEEYVTLGLEPFSSYMNGEKAQGAKFINDNLTIKQKGIISLYPHSIDIILGGKKLALCHFINDVRIDFNINSTWSYQTKIKYYNSGYRQFLYTNSLKQQKLIEDKYQEYKNILEQIKKDDIKQIEKLKKLKGFVSAYKDKLFNGKPISFYDAILQGHVHFRIFEYAKDIDTKIYTLRAAGMGYSSDITNNEYNEPNDKASYIILTEKEDGFDYQEVLVPYDRASMLKSIEESKNPNKNIERFVGIKR